jgi:arginine decarboxylase
LHSQMALLSPCTPSLLEPGSERTVPTTPSVERFKHPDILLPLCMHVVGSFMPRKIFLTKGVGRHKKKLTSFEYALRNAKIEKFNLVNVSSIFPPAAKLIGREDGLKQLDPGQVVFVVMSRNESNIPHRLISAAVGCAIPQDDESYGYLSEHHDEGQNERKAGDFAEDLAAEMLASTWGLEFDVDKAYNEQKDIFSIAGKAVTTKSICQTAVVDPDGFWTSVLAVAVLIL